ncbi:MAG: 2-dehydro-3-deoxyphosphogluconate aldolase, partial [Candidatus Omnitrophica bacterium]|nr:2-dehydro-3-deoxyphosphogluconate aldolase [Candidatus Omnitrophota bacterium]
MPVFPGAFTPQETYNAWNMGAAMVKVFPAKFFGPAYFKEIKGPFNNIELLARGGVNQNNIK